MLEVLSINHKRHSLSHFSYTFWFPSVTSISSNKPQLKLNFCGLSNSTTFVNFEILGSDQPLKVFIHKSQNTMFDEIEKRETVLEERGGTSYGCLSMETDCLATMVSLATLLNDDSLLFWFDSIHQIPNETMRVKKRSFVDKNFIFCFDIFK